LERVFGGRVYDAYGLTETLVGVECNCHDGFHYWEDSVYVEVVSPDTGEPLEDGEIGEIVVTSLLREAMPIIRYRTGDMGFISREKCDCGCTAPRVWIIGRKERTLMLLDGVKVPVSHIIDLLSSIEGVIPSFRLIITRTEGKEILDFEVEVLPGYEVDPEFIQEKIKYSLSPDVAELAETRKLSITVKTMPINTLPRAIGQKFAQIIMDLRH